MSILSFHEEICSKSPILIWRVLRHFLTGFPLLNNLVVLEAKDVDQRDPRTTRREPNSPVNRYQISVFKSAQRFKILLGKCEPHFPPSQLTAMRDHPENRDCDGGTGDGHMFVRFAHVPGGSKAQEGDGHLFVVHRYFPS